MTLAFKKLIKPTADKEGFLVGVSSPDTWGAHLLHPPVFYITPNFSLSLLAGPSESLVDFLSLLCFYEHFYASGKLLWNIFSSCLTVVLYLPVFVLYSISLISDSYLFLFLIAFPTLLLNFFALKKSFRVFIKECFILSWSLCHIFKLLPGYLKVFYPFSSSTYF